jgi:hypothetical protein
VSQWQDRLLRDREEIARADREAEYGKPKGRPKGFFDEIIRKATGLEIFELKSPKEAMVFRDSLGAAFRRSGRTDIKIVKYGLQVKILPNR